jgi:hypothetical protein
MQRLLYRSGATVGKVAQDRHVNDLQAITPTTDLNEEQIAIIFDKPEYQHVIGSEAFQRLREIRFLGAIDYVLNMPGVPPKGRHTRFQHSLRVAQLASYYSRLNELEEREETNLVIAALLHDIGHAPLSHSLEPTFKERFGLTHHQATGMIIRGKVPLGKQLPSIFQKSNIVVADILALIDGKSLARYGEAFSNPINIDTIEAITRSYTYLSSSSTVLQPTSIVLALVRKNKADIDLLDEFWRLKNTVYNRLITGELGLLADYTCQRYMEEHTSLWKGSYFHTETELRRHHPELFNRLRELKTTRHSLPSRDNLAIKFQRRRFIVDTTVHVQTWKDMYRRYKQTRTAEVLGLQ